MNYKYSATGVLLIIIALMGIIYFEIEWDLLIMIVGGLFILWAVVGGLTESINQKKWEDECNQEDKKEPPK